MADQNGNESGGLGQLEFSAMSEEEILARRKLKAKREAQKAKRDGNKAGALTITSLMDAMTILLVFLLVSITSDPLNVKQDDNLLLARSTVSYSPGDDSIPITVTKQHIVVDHKAVVQVECTLDGRPCTSQESEAEAKVAVRPEADIQLMNYCQQSPVPGDCTPEDLDRIERVRFRIDKSYKEDGNEDSFLIVPLQKRLQQLVKDQKEQNLLLGRDFSGVATIICDRNIPFRMLAEVVHTAGMAELGDIRFAVIKTSDR